MSAPSYLNFDHKNYKWKNNINYKINPEKYLVGIGEQGVLICEPYKSEILKYWRFKNREVAKESSEKIFQMFLAYLAEDDFVGADMARKFLQMGFTRSRRYANRKGGRKYSAQGDVLDRGTGDPEKEVSADIFRAKWVEARENPHYVELKTKWKKKYG